MRHRLAGVLTALGAVLAGVFAVRGLLALRALPDPPQLTAEDLAVQIGHVAIPLVAAYLVAVRRSAVGIAMVLAIGLLELPAFGRTVAGLVRDGGPDDAAFAGLALGQSVLFLVAAGVAWSGRHDRIRAIRSRAQPLLWLAAATVAAQGVFHTVGFRLPGSGEVRPAWYEPTLVQGSGEQFAAALAGAVLVGGIVALAATWPRDVAAGALMVVALPVLLGEVATLTRALRVDELAPTPWSWIVVCGAAIMVGLAQRWWRADEVPAEAEASRQ